MFETIDLCDDGIAEMEKLSLGAPTNSKTVETDSSQSVNNPPVDQNTALPEPTPATTSFSGNVTETTQKPSESSPLTIASVYTINNFAAVSKQTLLEDISTIQTTTQMNRESCSSVDYHSYRVSSAVKHTVSNSSLEQGKSQSTDNLPGTSGATSDKKEEEKSKGQQMEQRNSILISALSSPSSSQPSAANSSQRCVNATEPRVLSEEEVWRRGVRDDL